MKYIKQFETYDGLIYKVGDYVLFNGHNGTLDNLLSKIIIVNNNEIRSYDYVIESIIKDNKFDKDVIWQEEISRKLTEEEILKYDMIKNSNKYNL